MTALYTAADPPTGGGVTNDSVSAVSGAVARVEMGPAKLTLVYFNHTGRI